MSWDDKIMKDVAHLEGDFLSNYAATNDSVSIYIDATESMRGFSSIPNDQSVTTFSTIINSLSFSFTTNANYFAFGSYIVPLDNSRFKNAVSREFYNRDSRFNQGALLDSLISKINSNHLNIIVTDLLVGNGNLPGLVKILSNRLLKNNQILVIVPFRSYFSGIIYPDSGHPSFLFTPADNDNGHPFYILFIGNPATVMTETKRFIDRAKQFDHSIRGDFLSVSTILSNSLDYTIERPSRSKSVVVQMKKFELGAPYSIKKGNADSIKIKIQNKPIEGLAINDESPSNYTVKFVQLPEKEDGQIIQLPSNAIQIETQEKVSVVQFSLPRLIEDETYIIEIARDYSDSQIKLPEWLSEFNYNYSPVYTDGSRTLNLKQFMLSLYQELWKEKNNKGGIIRILYLHHQ